MSPQRRTFNAVVVLSVVLFAGYGSAQDPSPFACKTPRKEPGSCVPIISCPALVELLKPGRRTSEDLMYLKNSTCGFEGSTPKLCCPLNNSQVVDQPATPKPWIDSNSETSPPLLNDVDETPVDVSTSPRLSMLPLNKCGPTGQEKIINGEKAIVEQYPWMALLGYGTSSNDIGFHCGGTLISNRYVLTAAHCVTGHLPNQELTLVRLGELDLNSEKDCSVKGNQSLCAPPIEEYSIEEVIIHPNYSKPTKFKNDIALLRLNQSIEFKTHIRPICLPIGAEQTRELTSKLTVAGWGITEEGRRSSHLLSATLPIVPHQRCVQSYAQSKLRILSSRQLCAGGDGKTDSCSGDSGGPLKGFGEVKSPGETEGQQQMVQYGIVSFGPKMCATNNLPGVYTKVGFYMDWILNTLRE